MADLLSGIKTGLGLTQAAAQLGTTIAFELPTYRDKGSSTIDLNPAKQVLSNLNKLRQEQQTAGIITKQKEQASQFLAGKITQNILELASTQQSLKAAGQDPLTKPQAAAIQLQGTGIRKEVDGIPVATTTDPNLLDLIRTQQAQIQALQLQGFASTTKEITQQAKEVFTSYEKQIVEPSPQFGGGGGLDWQTTLLLIGGLMALAIVGSSIIRR